MFRFAQVKAENQGAGGLGFADDAARFRDKFPLKAAFDCLIQGGVFRRVLCFPQNIGALRQNPGAAGIERRSDQIRIGCAPIAFAFLTVQGQPVPPLEAVHAQVVLIFVVPEEINPHFHAFVLGTQDTGVARKLVNTPGDDGGAVRPDSSAAVGAENIGYDVGNTQFPALFCRKVCQPLLEEQISISNVTGGAAKNSGITGPAQALIPLGTVGGNIHKVVTHAPADVAPELIYQRIGAFKRCCGAIIAAQDTGTDFGKVDFLQSFHSHIPEPVVGKPGAEGFLSALADEGIRGFGGPQVLRIEISVPVQNLGVAQNDCLPRRAVYRQLHNAGKVLPEVQNGFPLGGVEQCNGRALLNDTDRLVLLGHQPGVVHTVKDSGRNRISGDGGTVHGFPVIELGIPHRAGSDTPAFIG